MGPFACLCLAAAVPGRTECYDARCAITASGFRRSTDGLGRPRPEWLEFWLYNHLLRPFAGMSPARDVRDGVPFVSLDDLLRSKETERPGDWQGVAKLEEIADDRELATPATSDQVGRTLSRLRSRRGFDRAQIIGLFDDRSLVDSAFRRARHSASFACPVPLVADATTDARVTASIGAEILLVLKSAEFRTERHTAAFEMVRREYWRRAMLIDRDDKRSRFK